MMNGSANMKNLKKLLCVFLIFMLAACGTGAKTWQDHYDLGMRYLSEGNYEEAILSFTAAIEIDDKRIEAFIGRGDAYFAFDELEEHFESAIADFETALGLDEMYVDAYIKLADVYFAMDETDKAIEVLVKGFEVTGDSILQERLAEKGYWHISNASGRIIVNEKEYRNEIDQYMDQYNNVCFTTFGIRFSPEVLVTLSGMRDSVKEAEIAFAETAGLSSDDLDYAEEYGEYDMDDDWEKMYNWDYLDKDMTVSGYFYYNDDYQRTYFEDDSWNLDPNGPYTFKLTSWSYK